MSISLLKFYIYLKTLNEGRFEDALKKQPQYEKQIRKFKETDPSGNLKYLSWQIKILQKNEPVDEIISLTRQFHQHGKKLSKKDINQYKSLGDLRAAFENLSPEEKQTSSQERIQAKSGAKKVFENEDILVIFAETKEASCYYGKGTRWCISATRSENYFEEYAGENVFIYFIIDKRKPSDDPMYKIAYVINPNNRIEVFDANNHLYMYNASALHTELFPHFKEIQSVIHKHKLSRKEQ